MSQLKNKIASEKPAISVERVQTGVRIEKRMLKVLKALAEHFDLTVGDLLEGVVLHAFEGKIAFSPETLKLIGTLKEVYKMGYDASASHCFVEEECFFDPEKRRIEKT